MFKKIFLLSGLSPFIREQVSPQIGIGYLAETLHKEGFSYEAYDYPVNKSMDALMRRIRSFGPDLIGIHMMSHGYEKQLESIKIIKGNFPKASMAVGGPHASIERENLLKNSFIDYCVFLEGEKTLLELVKGTANKEIKGLAFKENGAIFVNEERHHIEDLDSIPFPKYELFGLSAYPSKIISIVTSRGCPYQCIYCPVKAAIGCQFRSRSPENVVEEIKYWYQRGYREIWIQDDNFTLIPKRVHEILDMILKSDLKYLRLALPNGIRSDKADREMLIKMKRAGFFHIAFGVEAGNNRILKLLKKGESIEQMEKAIETALDVGIKVSLFFLLGSPGEKESDVEDSFAIAKKYDVSNAFFYNLVPFPRTELYEYLKKNNTLIYQPEYYLNEIDHYSDEPIFATPELNKEQRKLLLKKSRAVSKEIRGKYIAKLLPKPLRMLPKTLYPLLDRLYSWKRRLGR